MLPQHSDGFADPPIPSMRFDSRATTTELIFGARKLLTFRADILALRGRYGQEDDLTTDPQYFVAANTQKNKRITAVLIRRQSQLEACVLFIEHCVFGVRMGSFRGGDYMGDCLFAGAPAFRINYVHLATQALMRHWRTHSISFTLKACLDQSLAVMGTNSRCRLISQREIQHTLPLERTYHATLAAMGPRTRRSLAGKRRQLEQSCQVVFLPDLAPDVALEAMLKLRGQSIARRIAAFYDARHRLLLANREFFSMGLRLPDGMWLSVVSGWRRNQVTCVDLQMNDVRFKKESISAVMRAFLMEHEIAQGQTHITFVGGSSVLLQRYCRPSEVCTDVFLWRPSLRATLFRKLIPRLKPESVYVLFTPGHKDAASDC